MPDIMPTDLVATESLSDRTVVLSWNIDDTQGAITGYRIEYGVTIEGEEVQTYSENHQQDTADTTYTTEELQKATAYSFKVTALTLSDSVDVPPSDHGEALTSVTITQEPN